MQFSLLCSKERKDKRLKDSKTFRSRKAAPKKTRKHDATNNFFIHFKKINQIIKIKKGREEERGKS